MKAVILAGGYGTRINEESHLRPKPMIEIGGKPILWHIMKIYSAHGINDFVICLGYKGYCIKEYFSNYFMHMSDVTFCMRTNTVEVHNQYAEPWRVTLVNTGEGTLTGGRLKRVAEHIGDDTFCFTYGDGVSDVNITDLLSFHKDRKCLATVTAIQPPGRYGTLTIKDGNVSEFVEKPLGEGGWINGGFFVLEPQVLDYIEGDSTTWENEPMQQLALNGELAAYHHNGYWQAMDTLREKRFWKSIGQLATLLGKMVRDMFDDYYQGKRFSTGHSGLRELVGGLASYDGSASVRIFA